LKITVLGEDMRIDWKEDENGMDSSEYVGRELDVKGKRCKKARGFENNKPNKRK